MKVSGECAVTDPRLQTVESRRNHSRVPVCCLRMHQARLMANTQDVLGDSVAAIPGNLFRPQ